MKRTGFYPRLALQAMSKNRALYLPYLLMSILMVALHYIMCYLCAPAVIDAMGAGAITEVVMTLGRAVIGVFAAVFLYYCNTFLIGRRMREFGLYNILGMGKGNIARIMLWETLLTMLTALAGGLIFGVALARAAELLMLRLLDAQIATTITISQDGLLFTAQLFSSIYAVILLVNLVRMRIANPMEMLRSERAGERPPRANWAIALLGALLLGAGYFVALTVKTPLTALLSFFVAVLLVIAGTFLLFIAGSVTLCRLLQKNKKYYYQTSHFISLSSMAFRMKRNGGGLAAICILCTMVLVTLSSTLCLYAGIDEMARISYPRDMHVTLNVPAATAFSEEQQQAVIQRVLAASEENGFPAQNVCQLSALQAAGRLQGNTVNRAENWDGDLQTGDMLFLFYPLSAYESIVGEDISLAPGELLCHIPRGSYRGDTLSFYGSDPYALRRVKTIPDVFITPVYRVTYDCMILFAEDFTTLQADLAARASSAYVRAFLYFDVDGDASKLHEHLLTETRRAMLGSIGEEDFSYSVMPATPKQQLYSLFGSLFFIGLVLGSVFSLTAVLIIYYKQISEGYEDAGRFAVMRKVGLDDAQIHRSINSQVLTVFFAPLLMAGLHGLFAMPMVLLMLRSFGMNNASLFYGVSGICLVVFALLYAVVYLITSRTYYRIVR